MPQVPYQPFTTAQPTSPGEKESVSTPGAAFGENVGQALSNLGTTTEHAGDELFNRALALQELRNEADARNAQSDYATKSSLLHAQYGALEGQAAADQLPKYMKDQQDLRTQIRGSLGSPNAQKMYDADSLPFMQRNIFSAAGHAADQNKAGIIGTAQASMDIAAKTFVDPKNDDEFESKLDKVRSAAETIAGAKGWGNDQKNDYLLTQTSKLRAAQITQIAHTDPTTALARLDQNKEDMTQADYDLTTDRVRAQNRAVGGVNLANSVYDPNKTMTQMEAEVKAKAPDLAHDDPLFEKDAITALHTKYNQDKYATAQDTHAGVEKVLDAVQKGVSNIQELRAQPGMAQIIDGLPADQREKIPGQINSYNNARDKASNDQNMTTLTGMSYNDREGFLNLDIAAQNVSQAQMRQLMARRAAILKNPEGDPRLNRALGWMKDGHGSELQALGIYRRNENNADEYDHYTGALESAIDVWTQEKGKPPSYADVRDTIGKEVIQTRSGEHFWSANRPFFDQDVPSGWGDQIKADAEGRGEQAPTDEEIYRAYVRSQFIQLYSKEKAGGGSAPPQSK